MKKQELITKIENRVRELVPSLKKDECNYCKNRESFDDSLCPYCLNDPYMYFNIHLEHILEAISYNILEPHESEITLDILDSEDNKRKETFLQFSAGYYDYLRIDLTKSLQDQSLETLEALNKLLN